MASLIPMQAWLVAQINSLVFSFFWSCKKDLVARKVVYHFHLCGGFNAVFVQFKVYAFLAQWVRRFVTSPLAWVHMMTFCFFDRFGFEPKLFLPPLYFSY